MSEPQTSSSPRASRPSLPEALDLASLAATWLGAPLPQDDAIEAWVRDVFTDTAAMLMWLAACDLAQRGQLEDAQVLAEDACVAQLRDGVTSRFVRAYESEKERSGITVRVEVVDVSGVDVAIDEPTHWSA